ncbi:MAG TPA: ABC transporter ATP-binding protein [Anaerolineae bacterium]|nr:ABC transporter ATP-binding protein [Anaerolineae bacterium]
MPLLQATDLSHSYGNFQALAPTNLALNAGEISVLEGQNGAGKSTLMLCLSGLMRPTNGEIRVDGYDLYKDEPEAKRTLAFMPDVPRFYTELTAWEHLRFIAFAHGAENGFDTRAENLLREFGLWEARDLLPHFYSRGMSLKLGLLFTLIRPFKVLLLDEPASALDADSTRLFIRRLSELREQGVAILLSTHDPDFKTGLANRVYSMKNGLLNAA